MSAEFEAAYAAHRRKGELPAHRVHDSHGEPLKRKPREFPFRTKKSANERSETPHERELSNFGHFVRIVKEISGLTLRSFTRNQDTKELFQAIKRADRGYFHPPDLRRLLMKEYKKAAASLGIPEKKIRQFEASSVFGAAGKEAPEVTGINDIPRLLEETATEIQDTLTEKLGAASAEVKRFVEHPATNDLLPVLERLAGGHFSFSGTTDTEKDQERAHISLKNVAAAAVQLVALREPLRVLADSGEPRGDVEASQRFSRIAPLVKNARGEFDVILRELSSKRLTGLRREAKQKYQLQMEASKHLKGSERRAKRKELRDKRDARDADISQLRKVRAQVQVARQQLVPLMRAVRAGNQARYAALPKLDSGRKLMKQAAELAAVPRGVVEVLEPQVDHLRKIGNPSTDDLIGLTPQDRQRTKRSHARALEDMNHILSDWKVLAGAIEAPAKEG